MKEIFGYSFANPELLKEALTTPSYRMQFPNAKDNQRLEFLGDSVLQLLATIWLYEHCPTLKEGPLTSKRQHLVSTQALCQAAKRLRLKPLLIRNKGATDLPDNAKTIADAVEAIIGAAWLDGGIDGARAIFKALDVTANWQLGELDGNPKTALQHITQAMSPARIPVYDTVKTSGTSNCPVFTAKVAVDGVGEATGTAKTIKEAEAAAAANLLARISAK